MVCAPYTTPMPHGMRRSASATQRYCCAPPIQCLHDQAPLCQSSCMWKAQACVQRNSAHMYAHLLLSLGHHAQGHSPHRCSPCTLQSSCAALLSQRPWHQPCDPPHLQRAQRGWRSCWPLRRAMKRAMRAGPRCLQLSRSCLSACSRHRRCRSRRHCRSPQPRC